MIDGGDECAHNNKGGGPLRVHRSHSNLEEKKIKTNRLWHEEHGTRKRRRE